MKLTLKNSIVKIVKKSCDSTKKTSDNQLNPGEVLTELIDVENNRNKHQIFSESYQNAHEFGPFATVIKELLLEAREMARERYYEGSNLNENEYHERVLYPTVVVYRDENGNDLADNKIELNNQNNSADFLAPISPFKAVLILSSLFFSI